MLNNINFLMIFAVFEMSVIACHRSQVYKVMFCTFIFTVLLLKLCFIVSGE